MSEEQPKRGMLQYWPFFLTLGLFFFVYGAGEYGYRYRPWTIPQYVEMCIADYQHAPTARDTAAIDALTPPKKHYVRLVQMHTCGYFRKAGSLGVKQTP